MSAAGNAVPLTMTALHVWKCSLLLTSKHIHSTTSQPELGKTMRLWRHHLLQIMTPSRAPQQPRGHIGDSAETACLQDSTGSTIVTH